MQENAALAEAEFGRFVAKLGAFRRALSAEEQCLFDLLLLRAATADEGDVQGYLFGSVRAKHAALAAVFALGIVGGTLSPALGGSALAAPQEQPTLNGNLGTNTVGGTAARTPATGTTAAATGGTHGRSATSQATTPQTSVHQPQSQSTSTHAGSIAGTGTSHVGAAMPTGRTSQHTLRDPLQEALRGVQPLGAPPAPRQPSLEEQLQRAQDNLIQEMVRQREADIARQVQQTQDDILRQIEDEVRAREQYARQQAEQERKRREHAQRMAALEQQLEQRRQAEAAQAHAEAMQRELAVQRLREQIREAQAALGAARELWQVQQAQQVLHGAEESLRALTASPSPDVPNPVAGILDGPRTTQTGPSSPSVRQEPGPIDWVQ
jgi:hypothetical protein